MAQKKSTGKKTSSKKKSTVKRKAARPAARAGQSKKTGKKRPGSKKSAAARTQTSHEAPPVVEDKGFNIQVASGAYEKNARVIATSYHFLMLIPVIGVLILRMLQGMENRFTRFHFFEALNFQLTVFLLEVALIGLAMLAAYMELVALMALFGFLPVVVLFYGFVVAVVAAIRAHTGEARKYPISIRFL